jgi:CubicO group peptidase (beta-lactamase class C family)
MGWRLNMGRVSFIVLSTILALVVWTGMLIAGALEGWWRRSLAPSGDSRAFMDAAIAEIDRTRRGNVAFVLIENGEVFDEHFTSVGQLVDRNTLFQVASMSKWITAWGVMTLVEAGKLDLDAAVSTYLKRWSLPKSEFDNSGVTVRRLLSHTAGLTDGLGYGGFAPGQPVQPIVASLTRAADASPGADGAVRVGIEPGSAFEYSGGGYTLLQLIVEEVSGQSFNDYMRSAVIVPLGMTRSTYNVAGAPIANVAEFYDVDGTPAIHYRFTSLAATSLYTSAADLTRLIQAHAIGVNGEPAGRGVLEPKTSKRCAARMPRSLAPISGVSARCCTPATTPPASSSATMATTIRRSTPQHGWIPPPGTASSFSRPAIDCWRRPWRASGCSGGLATWISWP